MTVAANTTLRNAQVDQWGTALDSGFIDIYDGSQPVNPDDPPTGTLLVSIAHNVDAYNSAVSGSASITAAIGGIGLADGSAAYAQQRNAANTQWQYGSVSATGGGGDVELNNTTIAIGQVVTITTSTLEQPAS